MEWRVQLVRTFPLFSGQLPDWCKQSKKSDDSQPILKQWLCLNRPNFVKTSPDNRPKLSDKPRRLMIMASTTSIGWKKLAYWWQAVPERRWNGQTMLSYPLHGKINIYLACPVCPRRNADFLTPSLLKARLQCTVVQGTHGEYLRKAMKNWVWNALFCTVVDEHHHLRVDWIHLYHLLLWHDSTTRVSQKCEFT